MGESRRGVDRQDPCPADRTRRALERLVVRSEVAQRGPRRLAVPADAGPEQLRAWAHAPRGTGRVPWAERPAAAGEELPGVVAAGAAGSPRSPSAPPSAPAPSGPATPVMAALPDGLSTRARALSLPCRAAGRAPHRGGGW
ncbi:hypothetical protein [Streptomyces shenzhenensis]|uniref:hypothetical protein n=1 Tax=Streptomyces shenzhenensis TaxID=943815 RepID=UPI0036B07C5E